MAYALTLLALFITFASPTLAFGAGNIMSAAKIEGQNWRHGDIEDTLLTLVVSAAAGGGKFSKLDVKRVYFGNWLRDYSQAVDVGALKLVSADAVRIILWVLGFLTFGYGSREFEVTRDRLGCYRPEEHIDNPKDYNDNNDARKYDRRLRGLVEDKELEVDPETGLKNYINNEKIGIVTSSKMVRDLLLKSIELGRKFAREKREEDWYEALRLLGTALHCMEDFAAHSNYIELSLIELGERGIFPHVGSDTGLKLQEVGQKFPLVTGTFGSTDFLHSVCGEVSDKAIQSEIEDLEGTLQKVENKDDSFLKELLDKIPDDIIGSGKKEEADKLQENARNSQLDYAKISPREPEEWTKYIDNVAKDQLLPVIMFHDDIMQAISTGIEKNLSILSDIMESLQDELTVYCFSLIAPFILSVISQVKSELKTGSSEIIENDKQKQKVVFKDTQSSDPSHSMLSKDHFTNVLNEPAGKVACATVAWLVPQIIDCYNDGNKDANRTVDNIVRNVFHHPALRGNNDGSRKMFEAVERWWGDKSESEKKELREQLSMEGVRDGRNHCEGVHDTGHGSGKPISMARFGAGSSQKKIADVTGDVVESGVKHITGDTEAGRTASGIIGGVVGGFAGSIAAGIIGGGTLDKKEERQEEKDRQYEERRQQSDNNKSSSYNQESRYGSSRKDEGESYGSGQERYRPGGDTTYGGGGSEYSRGDNEYGSRSGTYGSSRDRDDNKRQESYGDNSYTSREERSSYNQNDDNERSASYGQSSREEDRRGDGSESYDGSRGYGQSETYGSSRRNEGREYGSESYRDNEDSRYNESRRDREESGYGESRRDREGEYGESRRERGEGGYERGDEGYGGRRGQESYGNY